MAALFCKWRLDDTLKLVAYVAAHERQDSVVICFFFFVFYYYQIGHSR